MFDFTNKTVLITGASRGIGRAIALQFATAGASIALHYNQNHAAAQDTLGQLPGHNHHTFTADLSDPTTAAPLIDQVTTAMGPIHILINNAAIYEDHPLATTDHQTWYASWQKIINTNLLSIANLMHAAGQQMIANGGGRIVNISSRGAFRGEPTSPAYGASKAGLNALSQSLAKYLAPYNIFVGVVAPGFVETDMATNHLAGPQGDAIRAQSPLNRVATPDEVAYATLFLAAPQTKFLTGAIIDVNGASYLRT
ncbi:MAG TPA: SDR family oxidoreductase [Anaerolineae bacterium]|nr:SDR family oxidoreductase [Anaerolineae bacterium]